MARFKILKSANMRRIEIYKVIFIVLLIEVLVKILNTCQILQN